MLRFGALNERSKSPSKCRGVHEGEKATIQEVKESEALKLYQKAIAAHHGGKLDEAEDLYKQLLQTKFVSDVGQESIEDGPLSQQARLKYLALKNLAGIAEKKSDAEAAMDYYIKAICLDDTDAGLWHCVALVAVQKANLILARHAATQGLLRNKHHWRCLDLLCTILYALSDDSACLSAAVAGLERDENFTKGLVFVQQLYDECPHLLEWKQNLKKYSGWLSVELETDVMTEILTEARSLRNRMDEMEEENEKGASSPVSLSLVPASPTWEGLGEALLELYNAVKKDTSERLWFGNPVKIVLPNQQAAEPRPPPNFVLPKPPVLTIPQVSTAVVPGNPLETYVEGSDDGTKKSTKRKLPVSLDVDAGELAPKRRSVRVRVNSRRKDTQIESVNYIELLEKYIPERLKPPCHTEDATTAPPKKSSLSSGKGQTGVIEGMTIRWQEEEKVKDFLLHCTKNGGVLDLMHQYLAKLGDPKQSQTKWPDTLIKVFLRVYTTLREHILLPLYSGQDESERVSVEKAQFCLCACELQLDSHKGNKPLELDPHRLLQDYHVGTSSTFGADLSFLVAMTASKNALGAAWQNFSIRVYWLRGRFALLIGHNELAVSCFCACSDLLAMERPVDAALDMLPRQRLTVQLPNCVDDCVINGERVNEKLDFIDRFKSVDEVRTLHDANDHKRVEEILTTSLKLNNVFNPTIRDAFPPENQELALARPSPERPGQLILLHDSLWKLDKRSAAFMCAELNLYEVSCRPQLFNKMAETLREIVTFLEKASASVELLRDAPDFILARLLQTVTKLIDCCMDSLDFDAFPVGLLWVLAYHLIRYGETNQEGSSAVVEPKSLEFLRIAHEMLGRHSACCESRGRFLLFALDAFLAALGEAPTDDRVRDVEQCFYCLYGHPSKKAKARKLQDHASPQIELNRRGALLLFQFYFPPSHNATSTFESSRIYVTVDLENLLRRIYETLSESEVPKITMEGLEEYLDGSVDDLPEEAKNSSKDPVVREIYHLLALYYLKNGEHIKAAKMYMNDLCFNPKRFDSWAGLALAKAGRVEDKLNALDVKTELPKFIERHSGNSLRAFEMARKLKEDCYSLIKQNGLFVYTLYSFASQQAKQSSSSTAPPTFSSIVQRRKEFLQQARRLFERCAATANDDDDDLWLYDLMLAKIAEKERAACATYLEKYAKALSCIDNLKIDHPRKIDYRNLTNHAIEALEVYYCLHCSVLKILTEVQLDYLATLDFESLEKYVDLAAKSSFALAETRMPSKVGRPAADGGFVAEMNALSPRSLLRQRSQELKDARLDFDVVTERKEKAKEQAEKSEEPSAPETSASNDEEILFQFAEQLMKTGEKKRDEQSSIGDGGGDGRAKSTSPSPPPFDEIAEELIDMEFGSEPPVSQTSSSAAAAATDDRTPMERYMTLVNKCLAALQLCSRRYPEHYKSIYRLAHAYSHIPTHMNLETARDVLWGPPQTQESAKQSVPPLFLRKGPTLFQIWKMRIDELERPGSFMVHVLKCVRLLVDIELKQKDKYSLLTIAQMLLKKADPTKRHIRDSDRMALVRETLVAYVSTIREDLNAAKVKAGEKLNEERCLYLLGLLRDVNQGRLLVEKNDCTTPEIDKCLADIFQLLLPRLPKELSVIELTPKEARQQKIEQRATAFCQAHFGSKQQTDSVSTLLKSSMAALFPSKTTF